MAVGDAGVAEGLWRELISFAECYWKSRSWSYDFRWEVRSVNIVRVSDKNKRQNNSSRPPHMHPPTAWLKMIKLIGPQSKRGNCKLEYDDTFKIIIWVWYTGVEYIYDR